MCFINEEIKLNVMDAMKLPADVENCSAIEFLGWDYCEEEIFCELFSIEEFLKDESNLLEEVNVVCSEQKFKPLDLQNKDKKKIRPSTKEPS